MSFESWRDYWRFRREVTTSRRYVRTREVDEFLENVAATAFKRKRSIQKGSILWRSQLGHDWEFEKDLEDDVPCAFPPARMKPLMDQAQEGRANPKGVPCLYLASKEQVAIAESRPWVGSSVSVAQFEVVRDLEVISCSSKRLGIPLRFEEPDEPTRENDVWFDIDSAFAEPVLPSDVKADYVPTQILAELFKANGFDGVMYRSALADGLNIALFDLEAAELVNCSLYEVRGLALEYRECANRYFVKKKNVTK